MWGEATRELSRLEHEDAGEVCPRSWEEDGETICDEALPGHIPLERQSENNGLRASTADPTRAARLDHTFSALFANPVW